eukprot:gene46347-57796_t
MWGSSEALKKAGVTAMPKTWDEFFAAADKLKAAGLIPVAHGGQNWQDFTTFESVVLVVGASVSTFASRGVIDFQLGSPMLLGCAVGGMMGAWATKTLSPSRMKAVFLVFSVLLLPRCSLRESVTSITDAAKITLREGNSSPGVMLSATMLVHLSWGD